MSAAVVLAAALLAVPATMSVLQDRLLYFPDRAPIEQATPPGLRPWPSTEPFRGFVAEPTGAARATAIVFHGNAGHAGHRAFYAQWLVPLGLRVILAEYPGYGPRDGAPGEASLVDDAEATLLLAQRAWGGPILLVGESLGAAVAAAVAARRPQSTAGLVLLTPWTRLADVAAHHYPWLPVRWLLRDRFDSVESLRAYEGPVVVVVAANDRIVPARFGRTLHDAIAAPKRLVEIPGSGHNDWPMRVDERWWREVIGFALGEDAADPD